MSQETETILEYASTQFGSQTPDTTIVNTEMVDTPTSDTTETSASAMENDTTQVDTPIAIPDTVVDHNKILEEISGGMFKDVETFKSAIPKFTDYDNLITQKTELEEKIKVNPFANDYVKTLNDLVKSGAGADQIKNFQKVNEVELDKISPVDAKIAKMVLIDGYSENIARKIVNQDYPLEDFEEGSDEREILEEKLRVNSKGDLEALSKYKADLSKIDNTEAEQKETLRLQAIAQSEQHKATVTQTVPKIAEAFVSSGEFNLNGKEGDEAITMKLDFAGDFKTEIPQMLERYFLDGNEPITNESVADAYNYIEAENWAKNKQQIVQSIAKHVESVITERMVNKYENRSGLPPQQENVTVDDTQANINNFMNRVANGR